MNNNKRELATPDAAAPNSTRRTLIKASFAFGAVGGAMAYFPVKSVFALGEAAPVLSPAAVAFQKLSQFLTSKTVNVVLAQRYYDALKKRSPDLDQSVSALNALVDQKKLAHMDDYLALQEVDKNLDTRAKTIVRAMYLGVVGDDENAELIAYKEAYMYQPTQDVLVVPTYGRGPASWGSKPVEKKV